MSRRVLLVLPERLRRLGVEDLLRDAVVVALAGSDGKPPNFAAAMSRTDADELLGLGSRFDLIIAHLDIPADGRSCPDETAEQGIDFLEAVRRGGTSTPCILLADALNTRLFARARDLARCELIQTGVGLGEDLEQAVTRALTAQDEQICTASVDITIDRDLVAYNFRCRGPQPHSYPGRRRVDADRFDSLAIQAKLLEDIKTYPRWMEALHLIGKNLTDLLIKQDGIFGMHLGVVRTLAGEDRNLRIRFEVGRDLHPIALEALLNPYAEDQFWMLEVPLSRRLRTAAWRLPLFHDERTRLGPLNCLILESDLGGYVPGLKKLPDLEHVPDECAWLEGFLKEATGSNRRIRFDRVERVSRKSINGTPFRDRVRDLLNDGTEWHLVHYGGHSYYDEDKDTGYVFFPGERGLEPIDIAEFVDWLRNARASFVFLSSCHSSHDAFAFELAHKQVPAILGFRWEIEDSAAKEHTRMFYTELFTGEPSLELAFQRTRKQMHHRDKANKIWAAPMMILQMAE
jgi:CHAT domain